MTGLDGARRGAAPTGMRQVPLGPETAARVRAPRRPPRRGTAAGRRVPLDPETVARDLTRLVLTLVELLRRLMERQALRRLDEGDLDDEQVENLGLTLMALEERMSELREHFGLTVDDLDIDLGPLGPLLGPG